eukprot:776340-Alexandrium_andersonii.AAC.1
MAMAMAMAMAMVKAMRMAMVMATRLAGRALEIAQHRPNGGPEREPGEALEGEPWRGPWRDRPGNGDGDGDGMAM